MMVKGVYLLLSLVIFSCLLRFYCWGGGTELGGELGHFLWRLVVSSVSD